jgi:hypothetical protein
MLQINEHTPYMHVYTSICIQNDYIAKDPIHAHKMYIRMYA